MNTFSLEGRGIGLSGGGGHLGRAMTLALAAAGATVAILGRRRSSLEAVSTAAEPLVGEVVTCVGDVSSSDAIDRTIDALLSRGVSLDGWVNNASGRSSTLLGELERAAVELTVASELTNVIMATERVGVRMCERGRGTIVNVSSMYGIVSPRPSVYGSHPRFHNPPAYGAAKAGLIQFSRYCAVHWASCGVRVNTLSPGAFPSAKVQESEAFIDALRQEIPMRRIGNPEELGGVLVFMLSDASSYMTGHNLVVDGGWTIW